MAIKLYTGLPGSGKSLSLVAELTRMHKTEPGRPVYVFGIDGLKDGIAEPCEPRRWQELPDGSIVVVDEAQKVWPSGRRGPAPSDISEFSMHRHRGFDFLIATQSPAYLDSYLRGLVDEHTHVVRRWGSKTVDRYVWQEGVDDPKSQAMRARAQRQRWKYPKECFDLYKSSTMHTVKKRMPWQWWVMIGALMLAPIMIGLAVWRVHKLRSIAKDDIPGAQVSGAASHVAPVAADKRVRWATVGDYVKDHLPRVANQPWSAPVFDEQAVVTHPDLLCIEYEDPNGTPDASGIKKMCGCYTEQVTPYDLHSLAECRRYARHGVYNPRRPPIDARSNAGGREVAQYGRDDGAGRQQRNGAGSPAVSPSGDWQPQWRTRSYVQPEKTTANTGPSVPSDYGG